MGTRHLQTVINKEGKVKVQQYGQWDRYPDGQGIEILNYLKNGDLNKYQNKLEKINLINQKQSKIVDDDVNWKSNYPYLSRDCGSDIHQMIENGEVKFVEYTNEKEIKKQGVVFYTINFQKELFITKFYSHLVKLKLNNLPSEKEYLKLFTENNENQY